MSVTVLVGADAFEELQGAWNGLVMRSVTNTIFLTYEWQTVWWEHLGRGDLFLITVWNDDATLIGIAPLFRSVDSAGRRIMEFVGCFDVSDYLDIIADRGCVDVVSRAVMDTLADGEIEWDVLSLCNIPEASPTRTLLAQLAEERGYSVTLEVEDVCPIVTLPATWDDYLAMLSGKDRRELRRKIRKAGRTARVDWQLLRTPGEVDEHLDVFFDLHQKSHPDKAEFMDAAMQAFFRAMARVLAEQERLELVLLQFDGIPVAAMLSFDYNNEILLYNSGYEAEGYYAALSPGWILTAFHIENAIERGKSRYDFLRGDEDYKYRFGGKDTLVYRLTVEK
ncbi:MAG: GNAT family N-acetyltransferase [Anaerolineae bacterium]